jgi:hypothetical protein
MACEEVANERVYLFRPVDYSKNRDLLPSWPIETEKTEAFLKQTLNLM